MAFAMHTLDNLWIARGFVVHGPFAHVIPSDEESGFRVVLGEDVEYVRGVDVRSVVEGERDVVFVAAGVDAHPAVADISDVWAGDIFGGSSERGDIAVAAVAVAELTGWPGAVVEIFPTG